MGKGGVGILKGTLIIQALGLRVSVAEAEASKLSPAGVKSLREKKGLKY